MKFKISHVALLATILSAVALTSAPAHADTLASVVSGTLDDGSTFQGGFKVTQFKKQGGQLIARGRLVGVITDAQGEVVDVVSRKNVSLPVNNVTTESNLAGGVCDVLFLDIGPIDLELLGLIVHVDPIVIDIDADPTGGILGSLLCSIADGFGGGLLGQIADLLNDILDILEGL